MNIDKTLKDNNIIKKSGTWDVYCGNDAYQKIREYSGHDLKNWIDTNINWTTDLKQETTAYFEEQTLLQYLTW
ncbi:MAG: hypothetical protein WCJ01_02350 [Ignavibacteria bacterium]